MSKLITVSGGGLRVDFERVGDRLMHTISVVNGCHLMPLLKSIEGTPQESWPASPAFQELHLEQRGPDVELALLVGMAGTSHWSASIGLDRPAQTLHFDIACRIKDAAADLMSTYEILAETANSADGSWQLAGPFGGAHIRGEHTSFVQIENRLSISPILEVAPKLPGTVRWQYFLSAK